MSFLVKFESNYSDEFDLISFALLDDQAFFEWDNAVQELRSFMHEYDVAFEFWFGTNELFVFDYWDQLNDALWVDHLNSFEEEALSARICDMNTWLSNFPSTDYIREWIADRKQEIEDESNEKYQSWRYKIDE